MSTTLQAVSLHACDLSQLPSTKSNLCTVHARLHTVDAMLHTIGKRGGRQVWIPTSSARSWMLPGLSFSGSKPVGRRPRVWHVGKPSALFPVLQMQCCVAI
ncbi:hypothetical protein H0G86_007601 [Trichoderma simmonsii]|uniref:Uncharacterized protein n=1 Tax=Trichoderma simmonsii TaxID=1491479 RepID=A0A8G0LIB3_9HYPO|nr:hypothetical protein H0G86_007601 [Trichoderma simmonsii]